ncbi:LruC domain-containing protein [Rubrolithibacter danxiaensis]|uniref:LruC domain-containing protein n=1 Tax=Rubrolithibacter danxiaensis TaxID=3390805 RepID=UPI003BF82AF5
MKRLLLITLLIPVLIAVSCKKEPGSAAEENIDKIAPGDFDFSTTKEINFKLRLLSNTNEPLSGVMVTVTNPKNEDKESSLLKAISDANGYVEGTFIVPTPLDTVIVSPNYPGLLNNLKAVINNSSNTIDATIGGEESFGGDIVVENELSITKNAVSSLNKIMVVSGGTDYVYPDGGSSATSVYQPSGKPKYLESSRDNISPSLLSAINASLPEQKALASYHPEYLSDNAVTTLNITKKSTVWITFVSEGADYYNSLGYYTYPTNNPPKKQKDIDEVTLVFPNTSMTGSGGGLTSGDKVKLGEFKAGTSIGFVLIQNGWTKSGSSYGVDLDKTKFYSTSKLNPESSNSLKKHSVLLYNDIYNLFLIGFEDLNRQTETSVNEGDFNDVIFYATASEANSFSKTGVVELDNGGDTDGDGVKDESDEFPNDPARAYTTTTGWSTLAFEDRWPEKGDYDLNDLVINYRYKFTNNAQNKIVDMTGDFTVAAVGASYENGFGVEFPFSPNIVSKVTGQKFIKSYIQKASNGLEAGQSKAVIIPFDNSKALIDNYAGAYFVNTRPTMEKVAGDTAHVYIEFTSPVASSTLGSAPFNPFMISNQRRGYEIHLPGNKPTDKADMSLFKTVDDNSNPATNRYYLTKDNWPWAINIAEPFAYPTEESLVSKAYLHFLEWAGSGGTLYPDWYKNTASGYRNNGYIYSK